LVGVIVKIAGGRGISKWWAGYFAVLGYLLLEMLELGLWHGAPWLWLGLVFVFLRFVRRRDPVHLNRPWRCPDCGRLNDAAFFRCEACQREYVRTFPKELGEFRRMVEARGGVLRTMSRQQLITAGQQPTETWNVEGRPATVSVIVEPMDVDSGDVNSFCEGDAKHSRIGAAAVLEFYDSTEGSASFSRRRDSASLLADYEDLEGYDLLAPLECAGAVTQVKRRSKLRLDPPPVPLSARLARMR